MNYYDFANRYEKLKKDINRHSSMEIKDNSFLRIENCRRVEFFDENRIILLLFKCRLTIIGLELELNNYNFNGVYITGKIHSIEFEEVNEKKC